MSDPAAQVAWGLRYIKKTYGSLTPGQAEAFYEDDEDPAAVFAAFDAGPKILTAPPPRDGPAGYECGFCAQGACGRCSDKRCTCCAGNPGDG